DHIDEAQRQEIARQAHLDVLIIASIRKLGRLYIIDLKALVPDRDEYLFTAREEGEGQESILTMLDRLAEKTRVGLKEKLTEIRATSLRVAEVTTPNLEAYQHYFKGEALINKLKFEAAQEEFEKAIAIDTTFGLAYYRLAYAISWIMGSEQLAIEPIRKAFAYIDRVPDKVKYLLRAEKAQVEEGMEAGIAILKEMERIYPDDKEMLYNIGDWSYHVGDETTAIEYLEKVLAMDPTNERALQHLSWAFRDLEQFDKMMEVERRFVAANKVEGNFLIGENYYHQGEYANAAEYLEKVLTIEPTHRSAVLHLIWAYRDLEQPDKLLEVAKSYSSVEEDSSSGYRMLGDAYRSLKDYGNAISNYERALKTNPDYYAAYHQLGIVYQQDLNDYEKATANYKKMIQFDYNVYDAYSHLGEIYHSLEEYDESINNFKRALKIDPERPDVLNVVGNIYLTQGNYTAAEQYFREALAIDSSSAWTNRLLGYLFVEQKRFAEAETFAQKSLAMDTSFASYNLLAWVLIAGELDIERGIILAQKALSEKPDDFPGTAKIYPYLPLPEHSLGRAYLMKRQYQESVAYLEQAAELLPERQVIHDDLAQAKRKLAGRL
ncbi:MAG: tetratricopeptide repeat protein, partial [Candidatus Marinimicrobia bacterium]|nr:tetratricopeptide repeat protein [Candidatus Neomarinimicrobiota bacterium]